MKWATALNGNSEPKLKTKYSRKKWLIRSLTANNYLQASTCIYILTMQMYQNVFTYRRVFFIVERPLICTCGVLELCKTPYCSPSNIIELLQCIGQLENSLKPVGTLCSCTCTPLKISQLSRDIPERAEFKAFVKLVQMLGKADFHLLVGS